jgi:hypothetical protein
VSSHASAHASSPGSSTSKYTPPYRSVSDLLPLPIDTQRSNLQPTDAHTLFREPNPSVRAAEFDQNYRIALERLENANLEDQMLSSFKRESFDTLFSMVADALQKSYDTASKPIIRHPRSPLRNSPNCRRRPQLVVVVLHQKRAQQHKPSRLRCIPTTQCHSPGTMVSGIYTLSTLLILVAGYSSQPANGSSKASQASPNYREEAEKIVADEREQSAKMPVYEVRSFR